MMKKINKIINKIKLNMGEVALETALVVGITLPIIMTLIFGGYMFFMNQAENNTVNFNAGRYISVAGCYIDESGDSQGISTMGESGTFSNYNLYLNDEKFHSYFDEGQYIKIYCNEDSQKGDSIRVITRLRSTPYGTIFPFYSARNALYTQEAPGK